MIRQLGKTFSVLVLSAISGVVGLALTTPFQAAFVIVLYFDLRVRKEGYDLELLAREMAGERGSALPDRAARPASAQPVFVAEEVDRTGAPFWPPPPGWKPGGGGA